MSEWISVKDRLPEEGQRVLIAILRDEDRRIDDAYYRPSTYPEFPWRDGLGSGDGPSVTHWMPLREPPK